MKYVLFFEVTGKRERTHEEREKASELRKDEKKYGKTLMAPHFYDALKGFSIVEFDNATQIENRRALAVNAKITAMPLTSGEDRTKATKAHGL